MTESGRVRAAGWLGIVLCRSPLLHLIARKKERRALTLHVYSVLGYPRVSLSSLIGSCLTGDTVPQLAGIVGSEARFAERVRSAALHLIAKQMKSEFAKHSETS